MHLNDAARAYILRHPLSPQYARQVLSRCGAFARRLQTNATIRHLQANPDALNGFLLHLLAAGRSEMTVRGYRACILAVWRSALAPGEQLPSSLIRRVPRTCPPPECWTREELARLFAAAQKAEGARKDGAPWAAWWTAVIRAGYSTGQRVGDLLRLRRASVAADGTTLITQRKTGKSVLVKIDAAALKAAARLPPHELLLPWPYSIEIFRRRFAGQVEAAGIRPGTFKWLRRSAGSYLELSQPGAGHRLLGNTRAVFDKHYADQTITMARPLHAPVIE